MPGIKCYMSPKNYVLVDYIVDKLTDPRNKRLIFDDNWGWKEIQGALHHPQTVLYAVRERGLEEPVAVVFFTNAMPYRDCVLWSCVFDKKDRNQGKISAVADDIKKDLIARVRPHSVSAFTAHGNDHSAHLLEKMGFEKVGKKRKYIRMDGVYRDITIWYLLLEGKPKKKEA